MSRVLVTGSGGFLGRRTCELLRVRGHVVQGYDLSSGADVLDASALARVIEGQDACLHLAAVADLYEAEADPAHCELVNVEGTRRVANACERVGARLLYASTCCVYGNNGVEWSNETSLAAPTELYAHTKLAGEAFVRGEGVSLRIATSYGPGMRASLATSVFLRQALAGLPIEIHGDGRQTRCYTHVDDVAEGIAAVLESSARPRCVNVVGDELISVLELAALACRVVGREVPLRVVADRPGQIRSGAVDASLLRGLGWAPRRRLSDGLAACVAALRES